VRELRNQIERIILLSNAATIDAADLDLRSLPPAVEVETRRSGMRVKVPADGVALEALERELIREALSRCNGNVSAAARFLRLSRSAMIYRMSKHKLPAKAGGSRSR
jgi:two-component system NtrC family response regulator